MQFIKWPENIKKNTRCFVFLVRHCAEEDMPVLVHPWDMANPDGRLTKYMMGWTVGMPMETHLSICAMVLSGAFDRLPTLFGMAYFDGREMRK